MKARVHITLKNGVLDPQGQAIEAALDHMGFAGVGVRVGKLIELEIKAANEVEGRRAIEQMCEKLLANTVIEKYTVEMV
ncbi:MAG: phosphoribosylformylglycinamidine synthase subunit PurS [Alphaproteobacteria bacterium]|nr:phosphoribosylformylglycinamidine synthase subunit PurS [Alphaproteobacteria bacterium]